MLRQDALFPSLVLSDEDFNSFTPGILKWTLPPLIFGWLVTQQRDLIDGTNALGLSVLRKYYQAPMPFK